MSATTLDFSRPAQRSLAVTACRLAESPIATRLSRRLRRFRYHHRRSDSYRLERPSYRVGVTPTEDQHLTRFTAHAMLVPSFLPVPSFLFAFPNSVAREFAEPFRLGITNAIRRRSIGSKRAGILSANQYGSNTAVFQHEIGNPVARSESQWRQDDIYSNTKTSAFVEAPTTVIIARPNAHAINLVSSRAKSHRPAECSQRNALLRRRATRPDDQRRQYRD
jgi:hypothetical protein